MCVRWSSSQESAISNFYFRSECEIYPKGQLDSVVKYLSNHASSHDIILIGWKQTSNWLAITTICQQSQNIGRVFGEGVNILACSVGDWRVIRRPTACRFTFKLPAVLLVRLETLQKTQDSTVMQRRAGRRQIYREACYCYGYCSLLVPINFPSYSHSHR